MKKLTLLIWLLFALSNARAQFFVTSYASVSLPSDFSVTIADTLVEASLSANVVDSLTTATGSGVTVCYYIDEITPSNVVGCSTNAASRYQVSWVAPDPDRFTILARASIGGMMKTATNDTLVTTAQVVQSAIAPDSVIAEAQSVDIPVAVYDASGSVNDVLFEYKDSGGDWNTICTDTGAPWTCNWSSAVAGATMLRATARQSGAVYIASDSVAVSVVAPGSGLVVGHTRTAASTSTGNQGFTITWSDGGSHTPTAAEFIMVGATADATPGAGVRVGQGAATSTSARWGFCYNDEDNVATSNGDQYMTDVGVLCLLSSDGSALDALADFVSFTPNTVTISWSDPPSSAWLVHVIAYTNTDAAVAGTFQTSGSDQGTVNVTALGSSANYVMAVGGAEFRAPDETLRSGGMVQQGFYSWDGATARQGFARIGSRTAQTTTNVAVYWSNIGASAEFRHGGPVADAVHIFSNHASGFTVLADALSGLSATWVNYLALDLPAGSEAYVGTLTTPSGAGTQSYDPGFDPQAVRILATRSDQASLNTATAPVETTTPDSEGISFGTAISTTSEYATSFEFQDGVTPTDDETRSTSGKVGHVTADGGTTQISADVSSLTVGTGFQLNYTTTTSGRTWVYCAFK